MLAYFNGYRSFSPCMGVLSQAFHWLQALLPSDRGFVSAPVKAWGRITLTGCLPRYSLGRSGREAG